MQRRILTVRKPEKLSMSRKTSFNKHNVMQLYEVMISPYKIYNVDKTACTTVQNPSKEVVPVGFGELANTTSAERGTLVTMIDCINAIGNHIPPTLIFPSVHLKEHMLKESPPGTIGAANQSGWSNEEIFLNICEANKE